MAALYAYESQQPEVMRTKREGLVNRYGVESGLEYFTVHETLDVVHSAQEGAMIVTHAQGHLDEIAAAVETALEATYTILDGVERIRTLQMPNSELRSSGLSV
jgi:pyrroloquinoline-quinone synthase